MEEVRFERTVVLRIDSGVGHKGPDVQLALHESPDITVLLTSDPDPHALHADRSAALGRLMFTGGNPEAPFARRDEVVREIQAERKKKSEGAAFLVIKHTGTVQPRVASAERQLDDAWIAIDAVEKDKVRAESDPHVSAAVTSLALESQHPMKVTAVTDGVVVFRDDGKAIYSFTLLGGSVGISITGSLEPGGSDRVAARFDALATGLLRAPVALFTSSLASGDDSLKAFLDAWTALELFTNEVFKGYENEFFAPLAEPRSAARDHLVQTVRLAANRHEERGGFRLADRFTMVAVHLAPQDADADSKVFRRIKARRDAIHREKLVAESLPVEETQELFRKYMRLHLQVATAARSGRFESR